MDYNLSSLDQLLSATELSSDDLFLISKKNDDNSYISENITYSNLASQIINEHEGRMNTTTYENPSDTKPKLLFSTCFIKQDMETKGNFSLDTLIGTKDDTNYYYRTVFSNRSTTKKTPTVTIYTPLVDNPSSTSDYSSRILSCSTLKALNSKFYGFDYDTLDFVVTNKDLVYIDNLTSTVSFSICIYENGFPAVSNYKNQTITTTSTPVKGTGGKVDYNCSKINGGYIDKPKDSKGVSSKTTYYGDSAVYLTRKETLYGYGKLFTGISVDLIYDGKVVKSNSNLSGSTTITISNGTYTGSVDQNKNIYYKVTGTYKKQKYIGRVRTTKMWFGEVSYSGTWIKSGNPSDEEYTTTTEVPIKAYTVNGVIKFENNDE